MPDYVSLPVRNGLLVLATEASYTPMCYYRGIEIVGMDIDLAAQFCEAYGYGLNVLSMQFDGILPSIQSGKADFAMAGLTITEERKESVYFSDPYYTGGTVMAILKSNAASAPQTVGSIRWQDYNGKRLTVRYGGPVFDVTAKGEELPLKVLQSAVSDMAYTWHENAERHNQATMHIRTA